MNEKLETAKRFLGNRYVLSRDYKPLQRHRVTHPVNTRETIREARERLLQGRRSEKIEDRPINL